MALTVAIYLTESRKNHCAKKRKLVRGLFKIKHSNIQWLALVATCLTFATLHWF